MPSLAVLLVISLAVLYIAHRFYGRLLAKLFGLDETKTTPAHEHEDGQDYVPTNRFYLLSQHFAAISAAGPIAGPIIAAVMFGWEPCFWWIILGCIFIGAMHDFASLVGSVRHGACSIAQILRSYLNPRSYAAFTLFIWLALILVVVAFTDLTASAFIGLLDVTVPGTSSQVQIDGGGVASSSMMYLGLSLLMGIVVKKFDPPLWLVTAIFVPAVGFAIWLGPHIPLDLRADGPIPNLHWAWLILVYCGIASMLPMWLLLQPRGYLGGFFLYITLGGGLIGLMISNPEIQWPEFKGFTADNGAPMVPFLFITIACGACSGFHGLVCSGTTSKQINKETDAHLVGYGGMLLEGVVALLALACVMHLPADSELAKGPPGRVFGIGVGSFLNEVGIPLQFAVTFGMLAFATFVYDTLDVCTRLARYLWCELTGWKTRMSGVVGTIISLVVPAWFVSQQVMMNGKAVPAYRVVWPLFGSINQLLAALTLVGLSLWLAKTKRGLLIRAMVGVPMLFMMGVTITALIWQIANNSSNGLLVTMGSVLLALATWITIEAVISLWQGRHNGSKEPSPHNT